MIDNLVQLLFEVGLNEKELKSNEKVIMKNKSYFDHPLAINRSGDGFQSTNPFNPFFFILSSCPKISTKEGLSLAF